MLVTPSSNNLVGLTRLYNITVSKAILSQNRHGLYNVYGISWSQKFGKCLHLVLLSPAIKLIIFLNYEKDKIFYYVSLENKLEVHNFNRLFQHYGLEDMLEIVQ